MRDRCAEQSRRRQDPGVCRDDNRGNPKIVGQSAAVHRAAAAKRQQRVAARIDTAADRYQPDRFRHLRVQHAMDAKRGLFDRHAQRTGDDALDRFMREVWT